MKLMINIPDDAYELLKHKLELDNIAESIIANGTPISSEDDLISRSELKKTIENYLSKRQDIIIWETDMFNMLDNAPSVAESCKELHEVATERPQTVGCFNCKHETKMICEEPCMVCNSQFSEWRQKE